MKANIEYGLQGAFKVDLYSGKTLMESTDYFSNFITPTGLLYPNVYAFADCFRFLSIGSDGNTPNRGGLNTGTYPNGTTGLGSPHYVYGTSAGNQSGVWIDWRGYETGSQGGGASACGTKITADGVRLFRAWSIPTGAEDITIQQTGGLSGLSIEEFMVSPSSGANATGKYAFSRVLRKIFIPNGYRAIVTYQLKVNVQNTGATFFNSGTFATGNAEVGTDLSLIKEWGRLSGYYKQVYHGLRCIDPAGVTFIPKYGDGLEPSCKNISSLAFYLSPDNSQFDISSSGGFPTSETEAYQADGLMGLVGAKDGLNMEVFAWDMENLANPATVYLDENPPIKASIPEEVTPKNIRLGSNGEYLKLPKLSNYQNYADDNTQFNYQVRQDPANSKISFATPGNSGWSNSVENYGQRAVFSTKTVQIPYKYTGANALSGRSKTVTRKSFFSPVSSLGYNTRFGSLVYAFRTVNGGAGDREYYPIIDSLFCDTSGRTTMRHYRIISGIELTNRGKGISECYVNIKNKNGKTWTNINRLKNRLTFQGPIVDGEIDENHPIIQHDLSNPDDISGHYVFSGAKNDTDGGYDATYQWGYGAIYGITAKNWEDDEWDCGLVDHSMTKRTKPDNTGTLYWPDVRAGNELILEFTGVKFYCPDGDNAGMSYASGEFDDECYVNGGGSNLSALGYSLPTGRILHFEAIGSSGYRLLPNHGVPNNTNLHTDYYAPLTGGQYPALSMDNGLEVYLDINWTSPCGLADECYEVPAVALNTVQDDGVGGGYIEWDDTYDMTNISGFEIWHGYDAYGVEPSTYTLLGTTSSCCSYTDNTLAGGEGYHFYKVKVVGNVGFPYNGRKSAFSNAMSFSYTV